MHNLRDKVALISGAASGIGRAIARELHARGAQLVLTDIDEAVLQGLVQELPGSRGLHLDVRRKAEWEAVVADVLRQEERIDILCANAGVSTMQRVADLTEQEWDFNFDVNAKGVFLGNQAVLPAMIRQKSGRIVNTASMAGKKGVPLLAHYAASKWAVIGFTRSLAAEVGEHGVQVNCVCPGFVRTSMQERELVWEAGLRGMTPEAVRDEYVQKTPLGRLEEAEDVARAVAFLCSDDAAFLTGVALDVTGGADLV